MKFFYRWFFKKLKESQCDEEGLVSLTDHRATVRNKASRISGGPLELPEQGLDLQIKSAVGGKIIIFRRYDSAQDRHHFTTYIINNDEDFEKSLSKIITLEMVKL